jgi:hypothetical protein
MYDNEAPSGFMERVKTEPKFTIRKDLKQTSPQVAVLCGQGHTRRARLKPEFLTEGLKGHKGVGFVGNVLRRSKIFIAVP